MIFLTVGTQFPFDRLIKTVDELVSHNGFEQKIFAQIGNSLYQPRNFKAVSSLEKQLFDKRMREASSIISHAGMGTIMMALDNRKPLLAMPRLSKYGEVVNDHQVAIARKFEELGLILVAYKEHELPKKLEELKSFVPQQKQSEANLVADRVARFLGSLSKTNEQFEK